MFIQHQKNIPALLGSEKIITNDFELLIIDKSNEQAHCTIFFEYLSESFECTVLLTQNTIQLHSLFPFKGIVTNAPIVSLVKDSAKKYLYEDGTITKNGNQNIVWLMLDVIHLYNLLRLQSKAKSLLAIYREVFVIAKDKDATVEFGKININDKVGTASAALLSEKLKIKHKYLFSHSTALLQSVQNLINHYPHYFVTPLKRVA